MSDHDIFHLRYAVRLPDGKLAAAVTGVPWMWADRDAAERAREHFRDVAYKLGVPGWSGEIVRQLCTPWVGDCDDLRAAQFVDQLTEWLKNETGGRP